MNCICSRKNPKVCRIVMMIADCREQKVRDTEQSGDASQETESQASIEESGSENEEQTYTAEELKQPYQNRQDG